MAKISFQSKLCYMIFLRFIPVMIIFIANLTFSDMREKVLVKDKHGSYFYLVESDINSVWFQRAHSTAWHLYSYPEENYVASFKMAEINHHLLIFNGVKVGAREHSEYSIIAYIEEDELE